MPKPFAFVRHEEMTPEDRARLRPCGECYACCVYVSIAELRKHAGKSCKHLDGGLGATTRCSIYHDPAKPVACSTFSCGWRSGLGPDSARPDKSGILVVLYPNLESPDLLISATITIIDPALAGSLSEGNLRAAVDILINQCELDDVRIVNYASRGVVHFYRGFIRRGELMRADRGDFEGLKFISTDPPIGHYERREIPNKESPEKESTD